MCRKILNYDFVFLQLLSFQYQYLNKKSHGFGRKYICSTVYVFVAIYFIIWLLISMNILAKFNPETAYSETVYLVACI